ncbi:leucine-rich repeat-containing protein 9-like isoform X2 [Gigantopelta aegis]|uniref:leucine-rich repeat-containing protein 9-like isoform X2 n=1 Tax=Gigantopelta aegis TaxID=1735272 RepID=UPI001B88B05F|nr:leucine-rich repeat-containing protein 9-like isoform X2 [Gigantopelta aegis]
MSSTSSELISDSTGMESPSKDQAGRAPPMLPCKVIDPVITVNGDEEILKEVCVNNGINYHKLQYEGASVRMLEMFFSGYPKITGLHHFPHLTTLCIIGQTISRIASTALTPVMTCLTELWICECQLKKIEHIDSIIGLKKLYLYGNEISVLDNLFRLTELEVLWLNNNFITNIENIGTLTKLKELNLANNRIEQIGHSLDGNVKLEELNLSGNKISSLRDVTNLVRLPKLTSVSFKDPLYPPCPASLLCNYSIHVMFHLPGLKRLDTYDVVSKNLSEISEITVSKKKMFYNMRNKTIRRNMTDMMKKLENHKKQLLDVPHKRLRAIMFSIKELEREILEMHDSKEEVVLQNSDTESEKDAKELQTSSNKSKNSEDGRKPVVEKLEVLKSRLEQLKLKCDEIEDYHKESHNRIRHNADVLIGRFLIELETGGNVRFEDGSTSDVWFNSCQDLVLSRFCVADYREHGIVGLKIHRIIRIHNKILKMRFDEKLSSQVENRDGEYYLAPRNTGHRKLLEYLFWVWNPEVPGGLSEHIRVVEAGFHDADTYKQLGCDGAVPQSNSLSLADRHRINYEMKKRGAKQFHDECPFRYGQLIISKVYLGKHSCVNSEQKVFKSSYPSDNAVFRPRMYCVSSEYGDDYSTCECSSRQCDWYIFDNELVLPEYIIDFEYVTKVKTKSPFSNVSVDLMENNLYTIPPPSTPVEKIDTDNDVFNMEPKIKPRPRLITLTDELLLKTARVHSLSDITVLNLHGNGLSKLKHIQSLTMLKTLIVSFNDLTRLDELAHMGLEYLDVSFNKIFTLEGLKGLSKLKYMDVSWNKLQNTREELSIMRKHMSTLKTLDIRSNPFLKPNTLRLRIIGRLKALTLLDGVPVTEEEATSALRVAAGSRISQFSLITFSRTNNTSPRSLSLVELAKLIYHMSRNKPEKLNEHDTSWYSKVTTLYLDGQHITKLSNLDRLENLKWASFSNNDLTKIEGLENNSNLLELSLENNCILKLDGISKLHKLQRLNVSNNYISCLEPCVLNHMPDLVYVSLEDNRLTSLLGLQRVFSLIELYVGNNLISNVREIFCLKSLTNLAILDLFGNPMATDKEHYRLFIIFHLKILKALDGCAVEASEGSLAKDTFGGRLTPDFIAEKLGHSNFHEVREVDLPNSAFRTVDLGNGDEFNNLRSINLEHNNLTSFTGLVHLVNVRVLCLNHNHIECILPKMKLLNNTKSKVTNFLSKNIEFEMSHTPVLPNLEVLHLGYNGIRDMSSLQLSRLPSLKALFLQGNDIMKVEGLDGLHDLRELVLDRNKIKGLSELSFINQWNLQELHLEENRLRELSNLGHLENLQRLYLGSNRLQDLCELEKLDVLGSLVEISVVNNALSRRLMHRPLLVFRIPQLLVIDGLPVSDEERAKAELFFADQQLYFQPPTSQANSCEATLPGIYQYKTSVPVKVTNMQLVSPPVFTGPVYYDDSDPIQRGGGRRRGVPKSDNGAQAGNKTGPVLSYQQNGQGSATRFTYMNNQMSYAAQNTAEYVENLARMNNARNAKK